VQPAEHRAQGCVGRTKISRNVSQFSDTDIDIVGQEANESCGRGLAETNFCPSAFNASTPQRSVAPTELYALQLFNSSTLQPFNASTSLLSA
jgi:hypothetical protein